jgi:hypothetical protein
MNFFDAERDGSLFMREESSSSCADAPLLSLTCCTVREEDQVHNMEAHRLALAWFWMALHSSADGFAQLQSSAAMQRNNDWFATCFSKYLHDNAAINNLFPVISSFSGLFNCHFLLCSSGELFKAAKLCKALQRYYQLACCNNLNKSIDPGKYVKGGHTSAT